MTASGIKFHERMMRLARYVAPIRIRGRRKVPRRERPVGPKLVVGRGLRRRRPPRMTLREFFEILVWTLVVVGLWSLWNYGVWGRI